MKLYKLLYILLILGSVGFTSCKSSKNAQKVSKLNERDKINLTYTYYEATKEKVLGNLFMAASLFEKCIKIDSKNHAAHYELAQIYFYQKQYTKAEESIEKAISLNSKNVWYKLAYIDLLREKGLYKKSAKLFEEIINDYPNNSEYYFEWAYDYILIGEYQESIKIYNLMEEKFGISDKVILKKVEIYKFIKEYNQAILELNKLIKEYPENIDYLVILAETYWYANNRENAYKTVKRALEINPEDATAILTLYEFYKSDGKGDLAYQTLLDAFNNTSVDIDTKIKVLMSYYPISDKDEELNKQAYSLIDILLKQHPDNAKSYSIHADFLYRDGDWYKARDEFKKVLEIESDKFAVWQQILFIDSELNDNAMLLKDSEAAMEIFPTQPIVYLMNGLANINLHKYRSAIEVLEKGIDYVIFNDKLLIEFYSYIAECYNEVDEIQKSYNTYEKIITLDTANSLALNNYSYNLSVNNDSLIKAEKMIKVATDLSPGIPSYEDTYAWVLYKLEKYEEAKVWIEKALENGGNRNDIILEHYGDILFKLGDIDEAIAKWRKARTFGKGSNLLDKKIKEEKLIE